MEPDPVKFVIGVIYREGRFMEEAIGMLVDELGETDSVSPPFSFNATDYYNEEMGSPLYRRFLSIKRLMSPGELVGVKLLSREIEKRLTDHGRRRVNLDPGYMDYGKFVLASFKYKANKIYLDRGVYADPALYYEKGMFRPYPWSFPDMRSGAYNDFFLNARSLYREAMKEHRMRGAGC
ncbi:MAG: DUF4416 family protein [Candidatus Glassbacteria bacterium]